MRNGYVSEVDTLALPSLDDGYCWLESPTALSATPGRRPPGLSRLENQLKEYGLIEKGQVLRPDFLLSSYNLPKTYLDPSEKRTAIQLHEDSERQLEIFSTPELQPSPFDESSICPGCRDVACYVSTEVEGGCGVCGWSGEKLLGDKQKCSSKKVKDSSVKCSSKNASPSKSRRGKGEGSGSIHCKPIKRGEKDYPQYWYHYEIWQEGDRLLKKTKYIPKRLLSEVQRLDQHKAPVREILKVLGAGLFHSLYGASRQSLP
ncbi:hypothetical protein [Coleofasciculus sp.]|uniref:hypothetical protein n=1 Tax=Coleofasciculus sp. TaxID=3100458 RepID=UPI0039F80BE1